MLVCFHPRHAYADAAAADAPVNFDKRAPYPIVNLLRTEQVDEYIDQGLTQDILERNEETLEAVGATQLLQLYRDIATSAAPE